MEADGDDRGGSIKSSSCWIRHDKLSQTGAVVAFTLKGKSKLFAGSIVPELKKTFAKNGKQLRVAIYTGVTIAEIGAARWQCAVMAKIQHTENKEK